MSMDVSVCPACGVDLAAPSSSPAIGLDTEAPICRSCGHGLWFRVAAEDGLLLVELTGIGLVTEQNIMRCLARVRELMDDPAHKRVLLDFEGVIYLSSTILGRLIALARFAEEIHVHLKLCNLRPDIQDIFRITRLERFFDRHPSRIAAVLSFEKEGDDRRLATLHS